MDSAWLEAIATLLSAIAAFVSIIVALLVWKGQEKLAERTNRLEERLTNRTNVLQEKLTNETNSINSAIAAKELLLTQRAQLVPIWQYWSAINHIDPDNPATAQVVKAVNTLELVALCYEGEMIDRAVVKRTCRQLFMEIYEEIERCRKALPGINKTGRQVLDENRATVTLYEEWRKERMMEGRIP